MKEKVMQCEKHLEDAYNHNKKSKQIDSLIMAVQQLAFAVEALTEKEEDPIPF